jgi:bacterial/archaeal transporter family-2 protein
MAPPSPAPAGITGWQRAALTAFIVGVGGTGALQAVINTRASAQLGNVFLMGTAVSFYGGWLLLCLLLLADALVVREAPASRPGGALSVRTAALVVGPDDAAATSEATALTGPELAATPLPSPPPLSPQAASPPPSPSSSPARLRLARFSSRFVLAVATGATRRTRLRCTASRLRGCGCLAWRVRPAWYMGLPGVLGATFVTASLSLTLVTGYSLYFVLTTAGFLVTSATLDHRGAFGGAVRRVTPQRLAAIALAMAGAVLAVWDRLLQAASSSSSLSSSTSPGLLAGCVVASLCAGLLLPLQASINRSAAERLPSKLAASWWSFSCGCAAIAVALAVQLGVQSDRAARVPAAFAASEWWEYAGGPLGVIYIASGIYLVRVVGSAPFFLALTCGQLAASAAIDATGAIGTPVSPLTPLRGAGIGLVMVAAAAMQAPEVRWRALAARAGCGRCCQHPRRAPHDSVADAEDGGGVHGASKTGLEDDTALR